MRKLRSRIFRSIFAVCLCVSVITVALVTVILSHFYNQLYRATLENEAVCLGPAVEDMGIDYLKSLPSEHRLTLVDPSGTVLYDSTVDASQMGNHKDRTEIREAVENGTGHSERYSDTMAHKTVNTAVRLKDGSVLRVSDTQKSLFNLLTTVLWPLVLVLVAAVGLSMLLAARVSASVLAPINRIDPEHPEQAQVYEELAPLLGRIRTQREQIKKQLEAQSREHDRQDAMRRDFTANVSHELKTPLTSISGYAEIMRNGMVDDKDIPRFAGKIYDESQRLITLVGDIIKLSQLDGKDISVPTEEIDLYETCSAVFGQLEMSASEHQVTMHLSGDHVKIKGAEQIVEEIIFNLCDNAVKYNRAGGRVDVELKQCLDGVEVTVADTGIGISEEDMTHIFERFYRVDKSHSKEIGGTGLGLSIVKHGAMFLGAKISVESKIGEGTKVRVLF